MRKLHFVILLNFFIPLFLIAGHRKVLLVGVDGIRSDVLNYCKTPNIDFISKNGFGSFQSMHQDITMSGPSWSSILCGVYHQKHGVEDNTFKNSRYEQFPMLCSPAKNINPQLKFGAYIEWSSLYNVCVPMKWDTLIKGNMGHTRETKTKASSWIGNSDLDFYFVYFGEADHMGHHFGFSRFNPFYKRALGRIDESIGALINAIRSRDSYLDEDWLILLTTDHGGKGLGHGGYSPEERQIMWWAYSEGIVARNFDATEHGNLNMDCFPYCDVEERSAPVQADIAITALHHLLYKDCPTFEQDCEIGFDGRSWLAEMGLTQSRSQQVTLR